MKMVLPIVSVALWLSTSSILVADHAFTRGSESNAAKPVARRVREPVTLAITDAGKTVLVANRRAGSLSIIDVATRKVVAEHDVGRGLADLVRLPGGRYLLAVDQAANELLLIDTHDRLIRVVGRATVSPDPVKLAVAADGSFCVVSARWSRRVIFVGLAKPTHPILRLRSRFSARSTCRFARASWHWSPMIPG